MSEKRFEFYSDEDLIGVLDTVTGRTFNSFEIVDVLNEQQATIDKLEQRDYYNQSERYKILGRAIELTINYIANSDEEHYDIGALITEFEKELLDESY